MKVIAIIPLLFSIVGFVLIILATFAGRQPGYMEDYAVIRVGRRFTSEMAMELL
jgi:hypothetical protein